MIEINQLIPKVNKNELFLGLDSFPEFNLLPNKGTNWYYNELIKNLPNSPSLQNFVQQLKNNKNSKSLCNHNWKEFDNLPEEEKKLIEQQLKYQLSKTTEALKDRGLVPGELQEIISQIGVKSPPKFDWKGYLRRFIGGSTEYYTKKTKRKRSKRFEENPGLKIKSHRHILVGLDTSGSVSNDEFTEFTNELHHIYKGGCKITLIQADAQICNVTVYKGKNIEKRYGNGGTDFTPVIDYLNKNKKMYSACVYLTDGECSPPKNPPKKQVLWVHSNRSTINKSLPGFKIKL